MRFFAILLASAATASAAAVGTLNLNATTSSPELEAPWVKWKGPQILGSYNEIDETEMHEAIECLQSEICARRNIPYHGRVRCTIGTSVAYICNYKSTSKADRLSDEAEPGDLDCNAKEMYEAWRQIRIARASYTGWWYTKWGKKTYGFDRRCPDNECDNGWKVGSIGEQCTNIQSNMASLPWLFDHAEPIYHDYTGQYVEDLPDPANNSVPVYFNPWYEGVRPT
ncbi:hypothetical protein B0T22DRAFT_484151 [Podospora appendiculata]|uniref:Ecp2 effector protein domain-containing protein n=1 Tax=Podospora appendiculata TaxID=314037 RepID=A0AAE0X0E6_9PEZI|nr:hypothetical protein B0T22DRAFT_484151 [Podospora appendiculata]